MPILDPRHLDENLMMVCDTQMTPDDIYTGLVSVLVRVEDTLRNHRCSRRRFHRQRMDVHTLLGGLNEWHLRDVRKHPIGGTFLDTMAARTRQLIQKARHCELDYVLLMKIVRMSMKLMVNNVMCAFVEVDRLRGRLGLPSKYGSRDRKHRPREKHHRPHHHHRRRPRRPPSYYPPYYPNYPNYPYYPNYPNYLNYYFPHRPSRWPYVPDGYGPYNPLLGPVDGHDRQLNGYDSRCPDCDKNRDVILAPVDYTY